MKIQRRRMAGQVPVDFVTIPHHIAVVLEKRGIELLDFSFDEEKNIIECKPVEE